MTELIPLADYVAPTMPTEHAVRKALTKLKKKLSGNDEESVLRQDGLERASLKGLDAMCQSADGFLRDALDTEVASWLKAEASGSWLKLLIVPSCDPQGLVEDWARAAGHQVLAAPARHELLREDAVAPDLDGSGLLVIPRLEHWFIRQRHGLHMIRALLARLPTLERRCLICCNVWAWRFLVKSVGADLLLPRPQTLAATDAAGLHAWFAPTAVDDVGRRITFRLAKSGVDVLATDDSGALRHGHLQQLAARSGGIPWVAVHLWRASLNVRRSPDEDLPERARRATGNDERTVWIGDVDDCRLPPGHEDRSLLALQALLIHESLTAQELDAVLPATGEPDVIPALVAAGFVEREGPLFRVRALAYPAVRQALRSAGFPTGGI
ncbi:hypothetical protein [Pseudomonas benzenivorans]|uniref:Uncharacterized protein n=1 Tax=Pseudomonas benzenivorans TaxID=556533 RepID=A0ABY5HCJ9_9PSED|nr:hypothetical protein [Pseudomonas benzenivorans]UTW09064.1 hypothetical protein KDW96_07085 [Pseudomonas benzenivorans]